MSTPFQVYIVSPDRALFSGEVVQIVAPAEYGELGILSNHIPLIATLKPGQVRLTKSDGEEEVLYVSGGFIEVQSKQTIILADEAARAAELDEEKIKEAKARAEKLIKSPDGEINYERMKNYEKMQIELAQLTAQLAAIRRHRQ